MIPQQIKTYLDNMKPDETLQVDQAKQPELLILAAKEYIDTIGQLEFSQDYTTLTKLRPLPVSNQINIIRIY